MHCVVPSDNNWIFLFDSLSKSKPSWNKVHCTSASAFQTASKWVKTHKRSKDDRRLEVTKPEMIDKIHDLVLNDRWVKLREPIEVTDIFYGSVVTLWHETLCSKTLYMQAGCRVCSQWEIDTIVWSIQWLVWRFFAYIETRI